VKRLLLEVLSVAVLGAALSLLANQLSPRGLQLGRDYFPGKPSSAPATGGTAPALSAYPTNASQSLALRIQSKGLNVAETPQVIDWFRDPRYQTGQIMFVDARDDANFQRGHIPGAYQLYYYQPEAHLPLVLQAGQSAEIIVIYCNGGDCEDSEFTAQMLAGAFAPSKLFVYAGGMNEWSSNSMPVELGLRNSGSLRNP
jgi:rhodanese-related sulfurtransferase